MEEHIDAGSHAESARIDLLRDTDVAYWCRLLDVDHSELRRAVQQVGPRAGAVLRHIQRMRAARSGSTPA
jgi:hypothetical protein